MVRVRRPTQDNWMNCSFAAVVLTVVFLTASTSDTAVVQRPPAFGARTDAVWIPAAVNLGNRRVGDLGIKDFEVSDNGVRQTLLDVASAADLPIDLTLVVDESSSVLPVIESFRRQIQAIADSMKPVDTIRLIGFSGRVVQRAARQPAADPLPIESIDAQGSTSLHDAIVMSLLERGTAGRQHVVVVYTDGFDNSSTAGISDVKNVAARTNAVLYVALSPLPGASAPTPPEQYAELGEVAGLTGGTAYLPGRFDDLAGALAEVFEDFRGRYLLYYVRKGVRADGWHDVTVRVTRPGSYTVNARKSYFGS